MYWLPLVGFINFISTYMCIHIYMYVCIWEFLDEGFEFHLRVLPPRSASQFASSSAVKKMAGPNSGCTEYVYPTREPHTHVSSRI